MMSRQQAGLDGHQALGEDADGHTAQSDVHRVWASRQCVQISNSGFRHPASLQSAG